MLHGCSCDMHIHVRRSSMRPGELGCGQAKLLSVSGSASATLVFPLPFRHLWEEVSGLCPLMSLSGDEIPSLSQSRPSPGPKPTGSLLSWRKSKSQTLGKQSALNTS